MVGMNQKYRTNGKENTDITTLLSGFLPSGSVDCSKIPQGDVPGERVEIKQAQTAIAEKIYLRLAELLPPLMRENPYQRIVLSVCGGSGVGKTGTASLLAHYFNQCGVGCYVLSGDNYPHRIPEYNDAERLAVFREGGLCEMIRRGVYTKERFLTVQKWQKLNDDAEPSRLKEYPWLDAYLNGGRKGLEQYLGTERELAFCEVNEIISAFKNGANALWLKRMGREAAQLWYDCIDFSHIHVLLIEWTHGNSRNLHGVDIPVLLHSTPQETQNYRKERKRDGGTDSAFTALVLEVEQRQLEEQASKAGLIVTKAGDFLSYEEYREVMELSKLRPEE